MDPPILAGMVFSLLVLLMVGGFILMFPLTRRVARLLEHRLTEKNTGVDAEQITALRATIEGLESRVQALADRQEFVDSLLERRDASRQAVAAPEAQPPVRT